MLGWGGRGGVPDCLHILYYLVSSWQMDCLLGRKGSVYILCWDGGGGGGVVVLIVCTFCTTVKWIACFGVCVCVLSWVFFFAVLIAHFTVLGK